MTVQWENEGGGKVELTT